MIKSPNQISSEIRFDWDRNEILEILNMPLVDLMWESQIVHRKYNKYEVQLASLYSVKTGGCEEDCAYCSQSIYSASQIKSHPQFEVEAVLKRAKTAKEEGADRFCMGWAWREIREGKSFNSMLEMIKGVKKLSGCIHKIQPDMIEVGSWIGLAALTKSDITIKGVEIKILDQILNVFSKLGVTIEKTKNSIRIPPHIKGYEIQNNIDGSVLTISDGPWPLFTPDLISIVLVVATQAKGSVLIHQKMFESRLFFVDKLIDMGAKIILCDPHRAVVIGHNFKSSLKATKMTSPDIRAGISLLIAALSANGTSVINNIEQIDRGYEKIDERLQNIGASIERIK